MTLADRLSSALNPDITTRILILDVERLAGISQQTWWDRGDLKNRYVQYSSVIRHPRTTIVCAKWHDEPDVIELAEWDQGGRKKFLRNVHNLMAEADIIVGHYITGADLPWLANDLYVEAKLPPLPPFKTIDTLKVIRKVFGSGAPFKSLDAFCQIANIGGKTDAYDARAMERAVTEKSVKDRERLVAYCSGDVIATQALYEWLLPYLPNPPALTVAGQDKLQVCHRCGHDTKPISRRYIANIMSYSMRKCTHCGGHSRISLEPERLSTLRSV